MIGAAAPLEGGPVLSTGSGGQVKKCIKRKKACFSFSIETQSKIPWTALQLLHTLRFESLSIDSGLFAIMKVTQYLAPLLAAGFVAAVPAPQAPQPPAPGQCQDVTCTNNDVCLGIGCGNCFIMAGGNGICLDPPVQTSKSKREAEAEPMPQRPPPGQCTALACTSDAFCNGQGCGNCFIMAGGNGFCLDPPPVGTS